MGRKAVLHLLHLLAVVFTGLLLAAALLSRYASSVMPAIGEFWVVLALLLPVILLANLAAFVWWIVRGRWVVALMPVAALVMNLNYISAMIRMPDYHHAKMSYDLRVASLNTHGFRRYKLPEASAAAMARMARDEQFDVFCMQEFRESAELPAARIAELFTPRMPYFIQQGGQAVVSRFPIVASHYLPFGGSNGTLVADLAAGSDTLRVISVHLQTSGISSLRHRFRKDYDSDAPVDLVLGSVRENSCIRAGQVEQIRAIIDTSRMRVIVAGDFNDTPSSYTYRRMLEGFTDGFRAAGRGYGGTFRYLGGILRIDYVFYDDGFTGVGYYMPREDVSDHKPVVADLRINR